jgi:hypothetical protein
MIPHKYKDVIIHYANGGKIQCRMVGAGKSEWQDHDLGSPAFDAVDVEWRIKPKTLRYRVALCNWSNKYYIKIAEDEGSERLYETTQPQFVKWLTDWIEVKI